METADSNIYPSFFRRVAATLIDLAAVFAGISLIFQVPLVYEPAWVNILAAIAFVLLYEPLLTAYGCTLGQAIMRTRVRQVQTLERITIGKSYLRFVLKYVASVAGAGGTRGMVRTWPRGDRRALHDLQADTVVVTAGAVSA